MKKNTLKTINEMTGFAKKMPKTINEMLDFECNMQEGEEMDDMEDDYTEEPEGHSASASQKAAQLIDSIRKQALRAMAELADNPEDENYIMLKKVWQMTDRKPEKEDKNAMM